MSSTEMFLILGTLSLLILGVVLVARPNAQTLQTFFLSIWNNQIGRHIVAIIILILALQIIKAYARFAAEDKANDWLTQYNGKATTAAVGAIEADVPNLFFGANESPSPSPSPAASATVEPSPSPSPSPSPMLMRLAVAPVPARKEVAPVRRVIRHLLQIRRQTKLNQHV